MWQLETMLAQGLPVIPAGGAGNNSGINPSSSAAIGDAANGGVSAGNSASQSQAKLNKADF